MISCPPLMEISATDPRVFRRAIFVRLGPRETHPRRLEAGESVRVRVDSGQLWVTLEGYPDDHVLVAGDFQQFRGPGLWVAEGIGEGAEFEVG